MQGTESTVFRENGLAKLKASDCEFDRSNPASSHGVVKQLMIEVYKKKFLAVFYRLTDLSSFQRKEQMQRLLKKFAIVEVEGFPL